MYTRSSILLYGKYVCKRPFQKKSYWIIGYIISKRPNTPCVFVNIVRILVLVVWEWGEDMPRAAVLGCSIILVVLCLLSQGLCTWIWVFKYVFMCGCVFVCTGTGQYTCILYHNYKYHSKYHR